MARVAVGVSAEAGVRVAAVVGAHAVDQRVVECGAEAPVQGLVQEPVGTAEVALQERAE